MRVNSTTLSKLEAFMDSLPQEAKQKCSLCNETLTHIVKQAEVATGAGTATVTRVLAARINEDAAPGDMVTVRALTGRVERHEGKDGMSPIRGNKQPEPEDKKMVSGQALNLRVVRHQKKQEFENEPEMNFAVLNGVVYDAPTFAHTAIAQLERIKKEDPNRVAALVRVKAWIDKQLQEI